MGLAMRLVAAVVEVFVGHVHLLAEAVEEATERIVVAEFAAFLLQVEEAEAVSAMMVVAALEELVVVEEVVELPEWLPVVQQLQQPLSFRTLGTELAQDSGRSVQMNHRMSFHDMTHSSTRFVA